MFKRISFALLILLITQAPSFGQGFYFGPKGGLAIGMQNWGGYERDPLFAYHGDVFIESLDPNETGSLFASIGYHVRGSAVRYNTINPNFNFSSGFRFNNASLMLGAKRRFVKNSNLKSYYHLGIRVEYTINTNLGESSSNTVNQIYSPFDELTNKITYGISGGAGFEFFLNEFINPFVELTISPDLSYQYRQEAIGNVTHPITGQLTSIPAREIRNFSIELSVGFKFLRKVVYVE